MNRNSPLPKQIVESLDAKVRTQLKLAGAIGHSGEGGRARENIVRGFIRKLVAASFAVDTGFVIDSQGGISKQVDIVVYRTDFHPVLEIVGIKHFLIESVVAIIENKARIGSMAQLNQALDNISSVKAPDRTNRGQNRVIIGGSNGRPLDPSEFNHQVLGLIVTQKSMSEPKLERALLDFLRANERRVWFNLYVDINNFSVCYLRDRQEADSVSADSDFLAGADHTWAQRLFTTIKGSEHFTPPLGQLAQSLVNFLRVTPLVDFLPTDYLCQKSDGRVSAPI